MTFQNWVVGIMLGYIASAGTNLMITFAEYEKIASLTLWSMGSFSGITWDMIKFSFIIIIPTVILTFAIKALRRLFTGRRLC